MLPKKPAPTKVPSEDAVKAPAPIKPTPPAEDKKPVSDVPPHHSQLPI